MNIKRMTMTTTIIWRRQLFGLTLYLYVLVFVQNVFGIDVRSVISASQTAPQMATSEGRHQQSIYLIFVFWQNFLVDCRVAISWNDNSFATMKFTLEFWISFSYYFLCFHSFLIQASSFSTVTDSTMSLNTMTVTLNMGNVYFLFFQHNFCVKPYVPREPRRNPSNRRFNEHGIYIRHCQELNSQHVYLILWFKLIQNSKMIYWKSDWTAAQSLLTWDNGNYNNIYHVGVLLSTGDFRY